MFDVPVHVDHATLRSLLRGLRPSLVFILAERILQERVAEVHSAREWVILETPGRRSAAVPYDKGARARYLCLPLPAEREISLCNMVQLFNFPLLSLSSNVQYDKLPM